MWNGSCKSARGRQGGRSLCFDFNQFDCVQKEIAAVKLPIYFFFQKEKKEKKGSVSLFNVSKYYELTLPV